jgi:hypothetical protein
MRNICRHEKRLSAIYLDISIARPPESLPYAPHPHLCSAHRQRPARHRGAAALVVFADGIRNTFCPELRWQYLEYWTRGVKWRGMVCRLAGFSGNYSISVLSITPLL